MYRILCSKVSNFRSLVIPTIRFNQALRSPYSNYIEPNLKLKNDVILFKYENPRYFKLLSAFGFIQYGFWMYLSHFAYHNLRDSPVDKEKKEGVVWWKKLNLGEQKYRNAITSVCVFVGVLMLVSSISLTIRSVRYLVLRKGGNVVSFVTYGPFGKNLIMDVPLKNVSASETRQGSRVSLPIKVKGKWFYYMLDMQGKFYNEKLFDTTVGLQRSLK